MVLRFRESNVVVVHLRRGSFMHGDELPANPILGNSASGGVAYSRTPKSRLVTKVLESIDELVGAESGVNREAIEQSFTRAGWDIDRSFLEYLTIGCNGDGLSIVAYAQEVREPEDPVFELIDHESNLTYGVQQVPAPQQAARLLREHGQPPEEDSDDSQRP
jgi:hypothetical protein